MSSTQVIVKKYPINIYPARFLVSSYNITDAQKKYKPCSNINNSKTVLCLWMKFGRLLVIGAWEASFGQERKRLAKNFDKRRNDQKLKFRFKKVLSEG